MHLEIVSPKGLYAELEVESLSVKLTSGYRTILGGHIPLIGALDYAPMHIFSNGKIEYFAIHGGAINVTKDKVVLIVNAVERAKDIDKSRALLAKERAEKRLNSNDINIDVKRAKMALMRALTRLDTLSLLEDK